MEGWTQNWRGEREDRLRAFFGLPSDTRLLPEDAAEPEMSRQMAEHLAQFNLEWHVVPSADVVPVDDDYIARLYPMRSRHFERPGLHGLSCHEALVRGHRRHQGRILAVETTQKPGYLPGDRQHYGTHYGVDATADPFAVYSCAHFTTDIRFAHTYASLREFVQIVNTDWSARGLMPAGYRLTLCPPAVFNLVGALFHREWSETETLELGFYRDDHGNATCYAVGCNAPGDFSYIHAVETASEWTYLGFRLALLPE